MCCKIISAIHVYVDRLVYIRICVYVCMHAFMHVSMDVCIFMYREKDKAQTKSTQHTHNFSS